MPIGEAESKKAESIIREFNIERSIRVGIHPGAAYGPAKRWLPERFAELAMRLSKDGISIILFGSKGEKEVINGIMSKSEGKAINLCGRFTIGELAAMMKKCDAVVTNDSGPMHLAGAVGAKLIAIFGSTSPQATSPSGNYEIIWKNVDCSPCFRRECAQDFKCMKSITTDEVYDTVKRMLNRGRN
jgi:heptosyltransferase-2